MVPWNNTRGRKVNRATRLRRVFNSWQPWHLTPGIRSQRPKRSQIPSNRYPLCKPGNELRATRMRTLIPLDTFYLPFAQIVQNHRRIVFGADRDDSFDSQRDQHVSCLKKKEPELSGPTTISRFIQIQRDWCQQSIHRSKISQGIKKYFWTGVCTVDKKSNNPGITEACRSIDRSRTRDSFAEAAFNCVNDRSIINSCPAAM